MAAKQEVKETQEQPEAAPSAVQREKLLLVAGGVGAFLFVALTTSAGVYFGKKAVVSKEAVQEEETFQDEIVVAEAVEPVEGLDLALPGHSGAGRLATNAAMEIIPSELSHLPYPPVSADFVRTDIAPTASRELERPMRVREFTAEEIAQTPRQISEVVTRAGGLGRSQEPWQTPVAPRPRTGRPVEGEARLVEPREVPAHPEEAAKRSTMAPVREYNLGIPIVVYEPQPYDASFAPPSLRSIDEDLPLTEE